MASLVDPSRAEPFARPRDRRAAKVAKTPPPRVDSILGRRDVALVPWASLFVAALAIALSTWLRSPGGDFDRSVVIGALTVAAVTGVLATIQDSPIGLRFRGSLWVYLLGSVLMELSLAALSIHQEGVATVFFAANVLIAAYLGLVLPTLWARVALVFLMITSCVVHVVQPAAGTVDALIAIALVGAAWAVGALGSLAHARAARVANALSSFDRLTRILNRRGLLQQVDRLLSSKGPDGPVALLIIDLDDFKLVNDTQGHSAGDALLAWVGETIPRALPAGAELGRLGGDEFAVLLRGDEATTAQAIAVGIRSVLSDRISAAIGVATSQTRAVAAADLFRVADAALYLCKADPTLGVHALVAGTIPDGKPVLLDGSAPPVKDPLSFATLRATGKVPRSPEPGVVYGWLISRGLVVIAIAGATVVASSFFDPGRSFYDDVLHYVGVPWVLWFLFLAWLMRGREVVEEGFRYSLIFYGSSLGLAIGVGVAMLAHGGLTAPIGAALFLRVLFDAAVLPAKQARGTLAMMLIGWTVVVALSSAGTLWVVPFHLVTFGASFALGSISKRAFDEVTTHMLSLARTDALTQVRNRLGFEEEAQAALEEARADGAPFGLLALDLDDFKAVNDTQGHAAGDTLLREVSEVLASSFPDSHTIGRLGGDEFVVVFPVAVESDAVLQARALATALRPVTGASIGHAVFPVDGANLDALLVTADHRSYEDKRARQAERVPDLRRG